MSRITNTVRLIGLARDTATKSEGGSVRTHRRRVGLHANRRHRNVIASLPMYERPELVASHDRYWALIHLALQGEGLDSPTALSRGADEFATWTDPTLVLSQTCGMPYRNTLHGHVSLIGTPDFGIEGCEPGFGRSVFVARRNDPRTSVEDFADATFAYNQDHSQSGFSSAFDYTSRLGFWFSERVRSGAHSESARLVTTALADIACIDAVTWRLFERYEAVAATLKVVGRTDPTPWLPYISNRDAPVANVFAAVNQAITELAKADRTALGIQGLTLLSADQYLAVHNPPAEITAALSAENPY